jgi:hypothetical protein
VNKFNTAATSQTAPVQPVGRTAAPKPYKFTMLMDNATVDALLDDENRIRKETSMMPIRSQIVRILLERLHEDELLFDEVVRRYVEMETERRAKISGGTA